MSRLSNRKYCIAEIARGRRQHGLRPQLQAVSGTCGFSTRFFLPPAGFPAGFTRVRPPSPSRGRCISAPRVSFRHIPSYRRWVNLAWRQRSSPQRPKGLKGPRFSSDQSFHPLDSAQPAAFPAGSKKNLRVFPQVPNKFQPSASLMPALP